MKTADLMKLLDTVGRAASNTTPSATACSGGGRHLAPGHIEQGLPPPPLSPVAASAACASSPPSAVTPPRGARQLPWSKFTPQPGAEAKVQAIEAQALSLGWTLPELWSLTGWYHQIGLVALLRKHDRITCVTAEFIETRTSHNASASSPLRFWRIPGSHAVGHQAIGPPGG
jgi:hypothetical protein